jgi:hypothetical protein
MSCSLSLQTIIAVLSTSFLYNDMVVVKLSPLTIISRPDMFHSLHCLNAICMNLNPVMYGNSSEYKTRHHHHGLPASVIALGKSGKRTCRKYEPIRKWMDQRGKGALEEI